MTQHLTRNEREALIAAGRARSLDHDESADLPLLAALLADRATWAEPSAGLEDTVVRRVVHSEPNSSTVIALDGRRRSRTRARTRILVPAAAAAAVIAMIVGSVFGASGGTSPAFTAALAPTGLVPGAHASADVTPNGGGFRVTLDAAGLEPLPAGAYYEAWLRNAAGTLVPIGTFSSSNDHVTLWSGVSPSTFTTLTVTIEQPDNDQASSGQVVLRGSVLPG